MPQSPTELTVLVIGAGGREHALIWALAQSDGVGRVYAAPGNPGMAEVATCLPLAIDDNRAVVAEALALGVDLVVIGPEAPLVAGLADACRAAGLTVMGPSKVAAQLEGSKAFTKALCADCGIPTARYAVFADPVAAKAYVTAEGAPIVVKADGLAAGKGVTVAATITEAEAAIDAAFSGAFGAAGETVLIEECLTGPEMSLFAFVDHERVAAIGTAQDYKRALDGDEGPNTGGMGAIAPALVPDPVIERALETIVRPTAKAMVERGTPYQGVLYAGLMLTADGPKLIEYNARFGDPETQALMMLMGGRGFAAALYAACRGEPEALAALPRVANAAITVVMASKGYPGAYAKGSVIKGLGAIDDPDVNVFQAGTAKDADGNYIATGGRVLGITARGDTLQAARAKAYAAIATIDWPEGVYRSDIGLARAPMVTSHA